MVKKTEHTQRIIRGTLEDEQRIRTRANGRSLWFLAGVLLLFGFSSIIIFDTFKVLFWCFLISAGLFFLGKYLIDSAKRPEGGKRITYGYD